MAVHYLIGNGYSNISLRIAAIIIITSQNSLIAVLSLEIAEEVKQIISKLNDLPDNLASVVAWETCDLC